MNTFVGKSTLRTLLTLLLLLFHFIKLLSSGAVESNGCFNGLSQLKPGKHPYLIYSAERIKKLQNEVRKDTSLQRNWNRFIERTDVSVNQLSVSRGTDNLCLAYLMTGDNKYASKVKESVMASLKRPTWESELLLSRNPQWNAGLDLSRYCYSVGIAFDCIYDYLTPDERKTIAEGLIRLGILPTMNDWILGEKRIHSFDSMGHNWWSACVFNAGIAILAILDDDPRAQEWLDEIMRAVPQWFGFQGSVLGNKPATFDREGGFYESTNYASYAMSEFLKFRLAYINAFPMDKFPEVETLEKIDKFFIDASYPNSQRMLTTNFGDGSGNNGANVVNYLLANGFKKDRYFWYLDQIQSGQGPRAIRGVSAFDLVYFKELNPGPVPKTPLSTNSALYPDMGWATMRSSWDRDATMLAVKSGFTFNHAHADAGSFILYHNGKNLITDSGNSSYSTLEYSTYYCQSEAHNVILFNGKGQNPEDEYTGVKNTGKLYSLLDAGDFKYLLADATGPYSHILMRNFRHFLWIGNTILIIDDVKAFEEGQFEWLLHYSGLARRTGNDIVIANGDASIAIRPLFPEYIGFTPHDYPERMKLIEKAAPRIRESDPKVSYYSIQPSSPARATKFMTAILLPRNNADGTLPRTEKFEGVNMIGVKIFEKGYVTYVYYNLMADGRVMHRPNHNTFDGWETDADIVAITYPEKADLNDPDAGVRYFVSNCSYLRKNGKVVISSLSKVFMISERENNIMNVSLDGQPFIDLRIRSKQRPAEVNVNNLKVTADYNSNSGLIYISKP